MSEVIMCGFAAVARYCGMAATARVKTALRWHSYFLSQTPAGKNQLIGVLLRSSTFTVLAPGLRSTLRSHRNGWLL